MSIQDRLRALANEKEFDPYTRDTLLTAAARIEHLEHRHEVAFDAESFCLVQDNDCHWYVIPADRRDAFDDWVRCQELGKQMETDLEPTPVNGSPCRVKFKQWEIE